MVKLTKLETLGATGHHRVGCAKIKFIIPWTSSSPGKGMMLQQMGSVFVPPSDLLPSCQLQPQLPGLSPPSALQGPERPCKRICSAELTRLLRLGRGRSPGDLRCHNQTGRQSSGIHWPESRHHCLLRPQPVVIAARASSIRLEERE